MLRAPRRSIVACVSIALLGWLAPLAAQVSKPETPARFQAEVVLVPVDVRVVDAQGNPITDLAASDFTIFENGKKQEIAQFATRSSWQTTTVGRTFAIVLGRGRLNDRGKAIDALIDFVRSQLQPQDRIGVFIYLRATDLTADHEAIARLLERYRARNGDIEDRLAGDDRRNMTDRRAGPNQPLSPRTRSAIEAVFDAPGLPATQRLPGAAEPLSYSDGSYLVHAIELLRHVEGEKHMVFVAERAPGIGQGNSVVRRAAAARVSVSMIETGGLAGQGDNGHIGQATRPPGSYAFAMPPVLFFDERIMDPATKRAVAEQTGGIGAFYQAAAAPLTRLARATSFEYSLGFYPATSLKDGEYRQLKVAVKRPGVTLLYRHGYEASPKVDGMPADVRQMFVTGRILDAMALPPSTWLPKRLFPRVWTPMTMLSASIARGDAGEEIRVEMTFNPSGLGLLFTQKGDTCDVLDVAVFVEDAKGNRVGEKWERFEVTRDATGQDTDLRRIVRVPVIGRPAQARVAIYEYETNHVRVWTLRLR